MNGRPGSSFRWPSRNLALEAERAATAAAAAGLERLRARTEWPRQRPERPKPPAPLLERLVLQEPAPEPPWIEEPRQEAAEPEPSPPPEPEPEPEPTPALWDAELDALTEELVAELRRDLGPSAT